MYIPDTRPSIALEVETLILEQCSQSMNEISIRETPNLE